MKKIRDTLEHLAVNYVNSLDHKTRVEKRKTAYNYISISAPKSQQRELVDYYEDKIFEVEYARRNRNKK